ncbi:MAG: hypothetical protein Q9213_002848 [Squamulea squamosa]
MHIRDRLRATLAQRKASQICWRCEYSQTQRIPSLEAAAPAKNYRLEDTSGISQLPHAKPSSVAPRHLIRLRYVRQSLPDISNGRTKRVLSEDKGPRIIRLQQDPRTGAQIWPSEKASLLVSQSENLQKEEEGVPCIRKISARDRVETMTWKQRYDSTEVVDEPSRTGEHPDLDASLKVYRVMATQRLKVRTIHPVGSIIRSDADAMLPAASEAITSVASRNTRPLQASSLATSRSRSQYVKKPQAESRRGRRPTVSAKQIHINRPLCTRIRSIDSKPSLHPPLGSGRMSNIRTIVQHRFTSGKKRAWYPGIRCHIPLRSILRWRRNLLRYQNAIKSPTITTGGPLKRKVRKITGTTPATIKSVTSAGEHVPVFIGKRRRRRYVIRDAIGAEAHIQYTGSAGQTKPVESTAKEGQHSFESLVEPDSRLLEETQDLLQIWLQAQGPQQGDSSSPQVTHSQHLTSNSDDSESKPAISIADCLSSTPACDESQPSDNAVMQSNNIANVPLQVITAFSPTNPGLTDPLWMAGRPTMEPRSFNLTNGHIIHPPTAATARSLHTSAVRIDIPIFSSSSNKAKASRQQVETQSTSPPETDVAALLPTIHEVGIRKHLSLWQELQNNDQIKAPQSKVSTIAQSAEDDAASIFEAADNDSRDDLESVNPTGVDQEGDTDDLPFLRSGDVVDMSTLSDSMLAIFTRIVGTQAQFYNVQGKWFHRPIRKVFHVIPRMFSLEELEPILSYLPAEEIDNDALDKLHIMDASIPRSVGAKLLERLQAFHQASAKVYREHLERIDRVHSLVAHEWQRREMSLQEIASIVLQKTDMGDLTEVELYTIHKVLIKDSKFRPQAMAKHRNYPIWMVNPLNQLREYEKVKQWLRQHLEVVITQATSPGEIATSTQRDNDAARSNPVSRFVQKARNLIQTSRTHRKVTTYGSMGPSDRQVIPGPSNSDAVFSIATLRAFDAEERIIIEYLKDWVLSMNMPKVGTTWSLSPMLLRAIGMYEGFDLAEGTGSLLLRELGVIAPWENDAVYSPLLRLPNKYDPQILQLWKNASSSVEAIIQSREHLEDSSAGFRKDWGNISVYCIDKAGAQEIDDGVSVEKINGQDTMFWLHIHIASPAAFVKPGSAIAQYAASLIETHYLPEKVYPMLKPELTQRHFSLANDRPVLTFSAKITSDGEILETEITPGWVRKIKRITPDQIRRELGFGTGAQSDACYTLMVGQHVAREAPHASKDEPFSPFEIAELRTLHTLGSARRFRRNGRSGSTVTELAFASEVPRPEVYVQRGGMDLTYSPKCARRFLGDPTISWAVSENNLTAEARSDEVNMFVTELMVMAGEIAANWCSERNIPIPFRGTIRNPSLITTPEAYKAQVLDPIMEEIGYVPATYRRAYNLLVGSSTLRSSPLPHALLGTQAYTKVTSPLRRYPDMLVHWQIQAALRHEAHHGQGSLIGSMDESYLPFSRAEMDALLPTVAMREQSYKSVLRWSATHWTMQLLHRAFVYKQAPLPSVFDVLVHTERAMLKDESGETMGSIKQLNGINADLMEDDVSNRSGGYKLGDWWQARIERVETYRGRIKMVPIRLTERVSEDVHTRIVNLDSESHMSRYYYNMIYFEQPSAIQVSPTHQIKSESSVIRPTAQMRLRSSGRHDEVPRFDALKSSTLLPEAFPIGVYNAVLWNAFTLAGPELLEAGLLSRSAPNRAVSGIPERLLNGTASVSPASYNGMKVKSITFRSFYFGCVPEKISAAIPLVDACIVTVTGYKTGTGSKVGPVDFKFVPQGLAAEMIQAKLPSTFTGLGKLEFVPTAGTTTGLNQVMALDDADYTVEYF